MLFSILGMILVPTSFHICFSKIGFVESDVFNKSPCDLGGSSLASKGVVCKCTGSFGGRTSRASLAMESSGPDASQVVHRGLEML